MSMKSWTWDRLFRVGNRVERRAARKLRRRERIQRRLERHGPASPRFAHWRARIRRISGRIERVEMRRQEVLRALKMKWLDDRDRISD
jgi:hypothetical protein